MRFAVRPIAGYHLVVSVRASFLLSAALLAGTGARAAGQIVRDARPPAAARDSQRSVPSDTLARAPSEAARAMQRAFEAFRRVNLPHVSPPLPGSACAEPVGKLCYVYDDRGALPPERDAVRQRRERLLTQLDSLARLIPDDEWITDQRVRYLAEAGRLDDALAVARACTLGGWRCGVLVGFALHLKGAYVESGRAYDSALAAMEPKRRCEWRSIYLLLDQVALGAYRDLPCDDPRRSAWEDRTFFLARTLYAMPGNDSRTEYLARMTLVHLLSEAVTPYQYGFDEDERELLLRFGMPRAWAAEPVLPFTVVARAPTVSTGGGGGPDGSVPTFPNVGGAKGRGKGGTPVGSYPPGTKIPANVPPLVRPPDMPGTQGLPGILGGAPDAKPPIIRGPSIDVLPRAGDGIFVVSREATPAYRYIPPGFVLLDPTQADSAEWGPQVPPVIARYAPPYATTLTGLQHQQAVFRRGASALVVMSYDARGDKDLAGAMLRAALVVTAADSVPVQFAAVRDSAPAAGVLTVRAPYRPLLMSAEVTAPDRKVVARARYGIGPRRGPPARVTVSDLLFYAPDGAFPASAEAAAPHALATERVHSREKLGVYWEAYGTSAAGEPMRISLVVSRENPSDRGFFRRMLSAIGVAADADHVSVGVDEASARGSTTTPRALEVDISTLRPGAYIVQLEITVAGQPPLRAEHRIEVVGP